MAELVNRKNLTAIILAGGYGTRLSEETHLKPKPMVEIGGKPILWHILKYFSYYKINNFIICCGYKGYVIKEFFYNYLLHVSDVTFDIKNNKMQVHDSGAEPWKITLIDTGEDTKTGGRLKRVIKYVKNDEYFLFTYGDGLCNVDINKLINSHVVSKKIATVTLVSPPGRYGTFEINNNKIKKFTEKPKADNPYINGGYFVLSPKVNKYIRNDLTSWEEKSLKKITEDKNINAYLHKDFWYAMDTLRDKRYLEQLWENNEALWKKWK